MRILVIGATGGTGREVVREALSRGYQVNALARSFADAAPLLPGADIIEGDVRDGEAVAKPLAGCHGVISALGTKLALLHEETLLSTATFILINEDAEAGNYEPGVHHWYWRRRQSRPWRLPVRSHRPAVAPQLNLS